MRVDVYHHIVFDSAQLDRIELSLSNVSVKVSKMVQEVDDVVAAVKDIKTAIDQIPGVVDAFEARITALIKSGGLSAADKTALQQATADLKSGLSTVMASVSDAADGIDEADTGTTPTP